VIVSYQGEPMTEDRPPSDAARENGFGAWTDHRIPEDRSGWHPLVQTFYDYWLAAAPPGRLPGRQHVRPEDLAPLLSRLWLLDVYRDPLRFRYRLAGTDIVRSVGRELTNGWLDEVQPETLQNPMLRDRYRYIVETGRPTWRRGPSFWVRNPLHRIIENCLVPLAADGQNVDMVFAVSVLFDASGQQLAGSYF